MKRTLKAKIMNDVTMEVPIFIDSLKPKLLKEIGKGGYGVRINMLWISMCNKDFASWEWNLNFCKKVGILVG